jgi:hypothetical protein
MFSVCTLSCQPEKRARAEAMLGELADMGLTGELTLSLCEAPAVHAPAPQRTPEPADTG